MLIQNVNTDPNLHKEVSKMFFELWDILIEAEKSFDEDLNLKTASKANSTLAVTKTHTSQIKLLSFNSAFVTMLALLTSSILSLLAHSFR